MSTAMMTYTATAICQSMNSIANATPTTVSVLVSAMTAPSPANSWSDSMSDVMRATRTPLLEREKKPMSILTMWPNRI